MVPKNYFISKIDRPCGNFSLLLFFLLKSAGRRSPKMKLQVLMFVPLWIVKAFVDHNLFSFSLISNFS